MVSFVVISSDCFSLRTAAASEILCGLSIRTPTSFSWAVPPFLFWFWWVSACLTLRIPALANYFKLSFLFFLFLFQLLVLFLDYPMWTWKSEFHVFFSPHLSTGFLITIDTYFIYTGIACPAGPKGAEFCSRTIFVRVTKHLCSHPPSREFPYTWVSLYFSGKHFILAVVTLSPTCEFGG